MNKRDYNLVRSLYTTVIFSLLLAGIFMLYIQNVQAVRKNKSDVKAVKEIIAVQKQRGAKVSSNLNNKKQYVWNKKTGRLQKIDWHNTKLKGKLNLNGLNGLKHIDISKNKLTKLSVKKLKNLRTLDCSKNKFYMLDLEHNKKLVKINCSKAKIFSLKIDGLKKLKTLICRNNDIHTFIFQYGNLEILDLRGCNTLEELDCAHNKLIKLRLKGATDIMQMDCSYNELSKLDLSDQDILEYNTDCSHNRITKLIIGSTCLHYFDCSYNNLKTFYIKEWYEFNELRYLDCSHNLIKKLDASFLWNDPDYTDYGLLVCDESVKVYNWLKGTEAKKTVQEGIAEYKFK